jgi:putative zinc finger protein
VTGDPHPFEHEDAAYVLGALSREDRIAYETHLQDCPRCSAAVAELAGLPGLLGRLPGVPEPSEPVEHPPDTVLPGILAAIRRHRSRVRLLATGAAAAAAVLLVLGTAAVTSRPPAPAPAAGAAVVLTAVGDIPVQADLRLQGVAWGTRITMTCRYEGSTAGGRYADGGVYELVVVSGADRSSHSVASWQALADRSAVVTGSTALFPEQIAEVQLRDAKGTVLLEGSPSR